MAHHNLIITAEHFEAVVKHIKRAEFRKNDRCFKVGDTVSLIHINARPIMSFNVKITHIVLAKTPVDPCGLPDGYCFFSFEECTDRIFIPLIEEEL